MDQVTIISIFVLLFALLLPGIAHVLRSHPRWFAAAKYTILAVYILANLYETILFRTVQPDYPIKWQLLWSYRESLTFPNGLKSLFNGSVEIANPELLEEIILNVLLYIPLGYLLPFTFEKLQPRQVVLIALACSTLTEITQLVFRIGWFEFDDMLNNTMGALIGLILYWYLLRRKPRRTS